MQKSFSDKFLTALSIAYIIFPVAIFIWGGVNLYISIPSICLLAYFAFKIFQELSSENVDLFTSENKKFWFPAILILFAWCLMSGIGGFMAQTGDFLARNPIYRDLCTYDWPIVYDLSKQSDAVQAVVGSGTVAFSYYLTYWLPPALLSKIFSFSEIGRNLSLYFYTVFGIFLVVYNLCRYFKKVSYKILLIFIFFSGLDIAGCLIHRVFVAAVKVNEQQNFSMLLYDFIETWAGKYEYLSNTTNLFWAFNQAVPTWLIVILFLQLRSNKNSLALSSLTFTYSAWAVFGMIPLALWQAFRLNKKICNAFSLQNIFIPLMILIIFGSFYVISNGADKSFYMNIKSIKDLCVYILVAFIEVGIYFLIMGKTAAKYDFYYIVLLELLLFPVYTLGGDLVMRGPLGTLFLFMIFIMRFLFEENQALRRRKIILAAALVIGAWTAAAQMNRSVLFTAVHVLRENNLLSAELMQKTEEMPFLVDDIYSFGKLKSDDKDTIEKLNSLKNIYLAYGYENSFFFKYLVKK